MPLVPAVARYRLVAARTDPERGAAAALARVRERAPVGRAVVGAFRAARVRAVVAAAVTDKGKPELPR